MRHRVPAGAFAASASASRPSSTCSLPRAARLGSSASTQRGVSSYLEVLDTDRQLFQAELDLALAQRNELAGFVSLYKALEGGWQAAEAAAPPQG